MPYFDRFDIVEAHWLYLCHWHDGTGSGRDSYGRLSTMQRRLKFRVDPGLSLETISDNGLDIYNQLVAQRQFGEWEEELLDLLAQCADNGHELVFGDYEASVLVFDCRNCKSCLGFGGLFNPQPFGMAIECTCQEAREAAEYCKAHPNPLGTF